MGNQVVEHGSYGTYCHRRCRCHKCRKANNTYMAQRRAERRVQRFLDEHGRWKADLPADRHGKESTYSNHTCRCWECTTAHRVYARNLRAGQRSRRA